MRDAGLLGGWFRSAGIVSLCAWVLLLSACGERGAADRADADGGPRVVALSPALGVTMIDLGLGHLVVGKHDYDLALGPGVPPVGHQEAIDYERLIGLEPTHVLLQWGERPLPDRLRRLGEERGWVIEDLSSLSLDEVAAASDRIWALLGAHAEARRETWPTEAFETPSAWLAASWRRRGSGADGRFEGAGRVLLLASLEPIAGLGPGSFHDDVLRRIGGEPAIDAGAAYIELDAEGVLRIAPDAIVLIAPRGVDAESARFTSEEVRVRLGRIGELRIPAVERGRLAVIDDPFALTPSTAMGRFADELAGVLGGWD